MLYFFFVLKFTVPFSILSHMFCPNIYKRFVDLVYDRFLVKFPAGLLIVGQCFPIELKEYFYVLILYPNSVFLLWSVQSTGGRYYYRDDWETPDTQVINFDFDGKKSNSVFLLW